MGTKIKRSLRKNAPSWVAALLLMGALAASITCARDFSRHAGGAANAVTVDSVTPPSGANTADVTITVKGTNFAGSHEVYVGASACTGVVLVSRNLLNAVVPAGLNEGSYNVTVISSQNGTGVGQSAYAVVDPTLIEVSSVTPVEGVNDVETPVTITGAHFVAPVTVDLGAFALLSAEVTAAETVTAIVPSGLDAGVYDLTVTNPDGSAATLTEAFEVIDAEALRVTGVTPSSAENDEDTDVVIAGANFESPVRVWLGEVELDDPIVQSDAAVAVTVPAGFVPGVYDVTVENPDAESDTLEVGFEVLEPGSDDDADDDTGDDDDDDADDDTGDDDTGDDDTGDDDIW